MGMQQGFRPGIRLRLVGIGLVVMLGGAGCAEGPVTSAPSAASEGPGLAVAAMNPVSRIPGDALPAHNFKLEIDGVIAGGFKEVSGLESELLISDEAGGARLKSEIEIIEYRDGDDPVTRKRPGKAKYKNIVLTRGQVSDSRLLEWYRKVLSGSTDRKSGSIIYLDREGREMRFQLHGMQLIGLELPGDRLTPAGIIEKIEIAVEKVERASR